MRKTLEKGAVIEGLLTFFAISIVIFAILLPKDARIDLTTWPGAIPVNQSGQAEDTRILGANVSSGSINVSTGNAKYTTDPMDEYIVIENRGNTSVNISGWRLENGKSARSYVQGSNYVQYASDVGVIPQGARVVNPKGGTVLENIVLKPNERAYVVSGGPGNLTSFPLPSFKENSCTGYLDKEYTFSMGLEKSCVRPSDDPGVSSLDTACRRYIEGMQTCHTPDFGGLDRNQERCPECVDGQSGLSSMCVAFIKSHFSYEGCLNNHRNDKNFEGSTWHVYLHRPWEMWDRTDEILSLYDSLGNLVFQTSY